MFYEKKLIQNKNMLTEKDYCDYDTCVALKELGYPTKMTFVNEFGSIEISINSGVIQLYEAQKWLREEKSLFIEIDKILYGGYNFHVIDFTTYTEEGRGQADGYEEALLEGIKEAVKILKEEK